MAQLFSRIGTSACGFPAWLKKSNIKSIDSFYGWCHSEKTPSVSKFTENIHVPQEVSMSGRERRISPRKNCIVPVRFRILANGRFAAAVAAADEFESPALRNTSALGAATGETVNLSSTGIGFRSRHSVSVGQPIEVYLTLPRELTGRSPEEVCCRARVVHVEDHADHQGLTGVGASIERFDPVNSSRNWAN